jgi:hypothetical protein
MQFVGQCIIQHYCKFWSREQWLRLSRVWATRADYDVIFRNYMHTISVLANQAVEVVFMTYITLKGGKERRGHRHRKD